MLKLKPEGRAAGLHRLGQPGKGGLLRVGPEAEVDRPSGTTAVASPITSPAPPSAKRPRWARCHGPGIEPGVEYICIGETTTRLRRVSPRRVNGLKSCDVMP